MRRLPLLAVGLALTGFNLRIAVASVPPLLNDLERHPGMSSTVAGLLTSLPVLCFGVGAVVAAPLGRRFGGEGAIVLALVPLCAGTALRAAGSTGALFAGTVLAGAGVAVANVLVPAVVKARFPAQIGTLMGLYTALLGTGAAVAGGFAVPLEHATGWRGSLGLWTIPALVALGLMTVALVRGRGAGGVRGGAGDTLALLRSRLAWQVTLFFALQSAIFYSGLTWLPSILRDHGYSASAAGAFNSVYALVGIPFSLVAPVIATRLRDQRAVLLGFAVLEPVAIAGTPARPGRRRPLGAGVRDGPGRLVRALADADGPACARCAARRRAVRDGAGDRLLHRRARAAPRRRAPRPGGRLDGLAPASCSRSPRRCSRRGSAPPGRDSSRRAPTAP